MSSGPIRVRKGLLHSRYKFLDIRPFVSFEMGQFSRDLMVIAFIGGHIAFHTVQCVRPIYQSSLLAMFKPPYSLFSLSHPLKLTTLLLSGITLEVISKRVYDERQKLTWEKEREKNQDEGKRCRAHSYRKPLCRTFRLAVDSGSL